MLTNKNIRNRGKVSLTKYFQQFSEGDSVAIVRDLTLQSPGFPSRIQGRTGVVIKKRGNSYVVSIKDFTKKKTYIVMPVHLKKITRI
ncbi:50S ribosomal protein L21e [Candidatus Pacearchaeota archaeon]|nr:50S ribosomal protein L21e [Candidatus Pacearchaeota archaeon]